VTVSNGVIDSANFTVRLELLAWIGSVDLDESLHNAFEGGLLGTDWDSDQCFEPPLKKLEVSIGKDEGGYVSFQSNPMQKASSVADLMNTYFENGICNFIGNEHGPEAFVEEIPS